VVAGVYEGDESGVCGDEAAALDGEVNGEEERFGVKIRSKDLTQRAQREEHRVNGELRDKTHGLG